MRLDEWKSMEAQRKEKEEVEKRESASNEPAPEILTPEEAKKRYQRDIQQVRSKKCVVVRSSV